MLFYDITRALTRVALGYAYEKGYVTGTPDLDSAVHYYESSHQYIVSHLANRSEEIKDIPVDDEAAERLAAFEKVDRRPLALQGRHNRILYDRAPGPYHMASQCSPIICQYEWLSVGYHII